MSDKDAANVAAVLLTAAANAAALAPKEQADSGQSTGGADGSEGGRNGQ